MSVASASQATARERAHLLRTAVAAARGAADVIRAHAAALGTAGAAPLEWRLKSPADFVTAVDTAAEERVREIIAREAPGAVILGEELSPTAGLGDGLAFVVDPLDGTTNFLHGYPWYAVSVAALSGREPVAAAVLNVPGGELYTAAAGAGAARDGRPIRVSSITDPARALVGTGFPFKHLRFLPVYQRQFADVVRATAGVRRAGSAALDLADVAAGRFDAFWELSLAPWDFAAGLLLIREAGGAITDIDGSPPPLAPSSVVAGNPVMHAWLLGTLRAESAGRTRKAEGGSRTEE